MKVYENIVIGNFLYALGFAVSAKIGAREIMPSVINLLQQTPADKYLSDILFEFPGVVRLIEFKIESNTSSKEKIRHKVLSSCIGPEHIPISRRIHWYVETGLSAKGQHTDFVARIVPYLDAFPRKKEKEQRLENFIDELANEIINSSPRNNSDEQDYLKLVRLSMDEGTVGSGGLLLVAEPNGQLRYTYLPDLMDLQLQHSLWHEFCLRRVEEQIDMQHTFKHQKTMDLDKGMKFSL